MVVELALVLGFVLVMLMPVERVDASVVVAVVVIVAGGVSVVP